MEILENYSLKKLNTFGIEATARYFSIFNDENELLDLLNNPLVQQNPKLILGGGSNVLFTKDWEGIVLKNNIKGITIIEDTDEYALVKVGSGEVWHEFVLYCIAHGLAGVENLSLIPGSVGAGPMQNIGAYGMELKQVFHGLEGIHINTLNKKVFDKPSCHFGYRYSVFKAELKGQYIITSVTFKLSKSPAINTSYGAIEEELKHMGITTPTIQAVSQAVCNIRSSKLPNPAEIGNAGSFFKNPEVSVALYNKLKQQFPAIVGYETATGMKLAAGWLIEQCGWKGKQVGQTGVHARQALVLVNYGDASGTAVLAVAHEVQAAVKERFGVELETEVNII